MTLSAYFTILIANLLGAMSPGPDVILITRMATRSRRHAIVSVCGIIVGVLMWCTLTVVGAAALLTAFPQVLGTVQLIGGAWLIYMGQSMARGGWSARHDPPLDIDAAAASLGSLRSTFALGLSTNLSNPKIVLFLAALVAPMLPQHPSPWTALALILGLGLSTMALFIVLSLVISTHAVRQRMLKAGPWIDIAAGTFFTLAGIVLIVTGLSALF